MKKGRTGIFVAAALVAGLALGSVGIASAAVSKSGTVTAGFGAGMARFGRTAGASLADVVAKLTGKTTEDVYTERQAGKSFAEIAGQKGISADKVVSSALTARKSALDAAVKAGTITRVQADAMYDRMDDRIPEAVKSAAPAGCDGSGAGTGRGQGGGGRMGAGRGGAGCGGAGCGVGATQ